MRMDLAAYLKNYNYAELVMHNGTRVKGRIEGLVEDSVIVDEDREDDDLVVVKYDDVASAEGKKL